tara:strand:- start:2832 stop:3473 length:642 start_codon:yes stop_codon:yes gene_type:complete
MKKSFVGLKIIEVKKELSGLKLNNIINLIKKENNYSILSNLSNALIKEYLLIATKSKKIFLFILIKKKKIVGYSLYAKKENDLIKEFDRLKFKILQNLIFKFKIFSLINIFLAITKLDLIYLNQAKNIKDNGLNLNLLAIDKKSQSMGLGVFFLKKTIKIVYNKIYKFKFITCEAPTERALNFYRNKAGFRLLGKKIRINKNLFVLKKNINEL